MLALNISVLDISKLFFVFFFFALPSCVSNRGNMNEERSKSTEHLVIKDHTQPWMKKAEELPGTPKFLFPVDRFLWVFYADRLVIHWAPKKKLTHYFKSFRRTPCRALALPKNGFDLFEGSSNCTPSVDLYSKNPLDRRRKIDLRGDEVIVNFTDRSEYVFEKNGKFLRKQNTKKQMLLGKDRSLVVIKKIKGRNTGYFTGQSVNELFPILDYLSLGDWLLLEEKMKVFGSDPETFQYRGTKIHMVFRKGGYIVKTFENPDGRYSIREFGEGFYIDKLDGKRMRPYLWFGKSIVELAKKNYYCYENENERTCVKDKENIIRSVFQNTFYRMVVIRADDNEKVYITWLNK